MSSRAQRRRAKPTAPPPLCRDETYDLAGRLLRELVVVTGDRDGVNAVLSRWLDSYGSRTLAHVCMAAVADTFATCLIPVPENALPPDGVIFGRLPTPQPQGATA